MKLTGLVGPLFCLSVSSLIVYAQSVKVSGDNSRRLNLPEVRTFGRRTYEANQN